MKYTVCLHGYIGGTDHGQAAGGVAFAGVFQINCTVAADNIRLIKIFGFEDAAIAAASGFHIADAVDFGAAQKLAVHGHIASGVGILGTHGQHAVHSAGNGNIVHTQQGHITGNRLQAHIQLQGRVGNFNGQIVGNVLGCGQLVGRFIIGHTVGQSRPGILCSDRCAVDTETIRGGRCRNKSVRADAQILCIHRFRVGRTRQRSLSIVTFTFANCHTISTRGIRAGKLDRTHRAALVFHRQSLGFDLERAKGRIPKQH